ncbi:hypothetical protein SanaruYs_15110 [Chryseotalea sanaruensis]|uniref:Uncharacterized protein n=1 Tax=Chryseotalea sanaruensis TaxID=2482724 RepID=A0A401U8R2_9BACT|nr:hypothetical protein SanaruYs_15110 [Chryseotalea sanaruensis]
MPGSVGACLISLGYFQYSKFLIYQGRNPAGNILHDQSALRLFVKTQAHAHEKTYRYFLSADSLIRLPIKSRKDERVSE